MFFMEKAALEKSEKKKKNAPLKPVQARVLPRMRRLLHPARKYSEIL